MSFLRNEKSDFDDLIFAEDYLIVQGKEGRRLGLHYRCPGCNNITGINSSPHPISTEPAWEINFETLTATPSIIHDRKKGGCGWHGYLTNGELKGEIEH